MISRNTSRLFTIFYPLFLITTFFYGVFFAIDVIEPGFFSRFVSLNYFLISAITCGVISLLNYEYVQPQFKKLKIVIAVPLHLLVIIVIYKVVPLLLSPALAPPFSQQYTWALIAVYIAFASWYYHELYKNNN